MSMDEQERYCSSYYDRHGLYNDGFPCPEGKYCCQNEQDGTKSCCDIVKQTVKTHRPSGNRHLTATTKTILNTISTPHRLNSDYDTAVNSASNSDQQSIHLFNSSALAPLFLANSNLIIITGISLAILLLTTLLIVVCICRCFKKAADNNKSKTSGIKDYKNILISHPKPLYDYKLNDDQQDTSRRHLTKAGSNTTTAGSSSSRNTTMILMSASSSCSSSQAPPPAYSRNSASVASTTSGVSTGSSSLHSSPKANQLLTVCCDNDNQTKTVLTSNLNSCAASSVNMNGGKLQQMNLMLNSNRSSVSNQTASMVAAHSLFNPSRNYMALLSAGAGATVTNSLAPMATSSLVGNAIEFDVNEMVLNDLCDDDDEDESDLLEQMNENDYIMNTSSNLEFLKAHSLFNKTAPLNFYPSLSMPPVEANIKPISTNDSSQHQHQTVVVNTPNKLNLNASMSSSSSGVDLRFSTFLPTK